VHLLDGLTRAVFHCVGDGNYPGDRLVHGHQHRGLAFTLQARDGGRNLAGIQPAPGHHPRAADEHLFSFYLCFYAVSGAGCKPFRRSQRQLAVASFRHQRLSQGVLGAFLDRRSQAQ